jgi:hypothetical protein
MFGCIVGLRHDRRPCILVKANVALMCCGISHAAPLTMTPVSKPSVRINLLQALCAIILGNLAYFFLAPSLPLPRHQPFQFDVGLVVDFWFCVVAYGLIRTAGRWK